MISKNSLQYLRNPLKLIVRIGRDSFLRPLNDEAYLKLLYRANMGEPLNLERPVGFNEKLQWLKINNRDSKYSLMADKHSVKQYVTSLIGSKYVIKELGVWDDFSDINFSELPDRFVLKCTHNSGFIAVCRDKRNFDKKSAEKLLSHGMKLNYYWWGREWAYKNIKPRILAEEYVESHDFKELRDYKFFCFDGEPKVMFIATNRFNKEGELKFDFFDMDFNCLEIQQGHPTSEHPPEKPAQFALMKELAQTLSSGIPHVRVDFYEADGRVYFGEFTFYHFGGLVPFVPERWDKIFGSWIKLPVET